MPEPKTKRAKLAHAVTGAVVWHRYITSVLGKVPERRYKDENGEEEILPGGPAWFHIFETEEPDAGLRTQRVWGCDVSEAEGAL